MTKLPPVSRAMLRGLFTVARVAIAWSVDAADPLPTTVVTRPSDKRYDRTRWLYESQMNATVSATLNARSHGPLNRAFMPTSSTKLLVSKRPATVVTVNGALVVTV